jgi:hypothetical protein
MKRATAVDKNFMVDLVEFCQVKITVEDEKTTSIRRCAFVINSKTETDEIRKYGPF